MKNRIELVDALRGFAIVAIVLLHNMEHFEFVYQPSYFPDWLKNLNNNIMQFFYLLFGGKAYAIFALLFGFSFQIQKTNYEKLGNDFRPRFILRMFLLFIFGIINTAFYQGDILTMYAMLSVILLITYNFSAKSTLIISIILLLQPIDWFRVLYALINSDYIKPEYASTAYYKQISGYMINGNFIDYIVGNLTLGKAASLLWSYENGRFLQAPALFLLGSYFAQKKYFEVNPNNYAIWKKLLWLASICFVPLFFTSNYLMTSNIRKSASLPLNVIITSWANFSLMLVWISLFVVLYQKPSTEKILKKLIPLGKMGLTCYILQSIIGSIIYYKYAFALYQYTGVLHCLFIGIFVLFANLIFCKWWLKNHNYGPLEFLWNKATFIKISK